jgi:hypothetical protein
MEPGIFIATSEIEPKRSFIFSAHDGTEVWKIHYAVLMKGRHPNKRLQDHFKKNPDDSFSVRLLFACGKNEWVKYTSHFIEKNKPYFNLKGRSKNESESV